MKLFYNCIDMYKLHSVSTFPSTKLDRNAFLIISVAAPAHAA